MKWIDSTILRNWAMRRDCQENITLLARKLIRATSTSIKSISFPAGENVLIGGWDGILEVYDEAEYLPLGISLWEFGTNKNINDKADSDYDKRKANALGYNPRDVTYIFVTPRLWTKRDEWKAEKKAEGHWKDVRVYDAQDLEEWIDSAPSVGAWLAVNHLNIFPNGVQSADDYWDEWSTGNKVRFTPDVVLAGRVQQVEKLFAESQQPAIVPVKASSREESIAFIVAAFKNDNVIAEDFFARALVIDTVEAFRAIILVQKPLYLIIRFEDDNIINRAKNKGHTVYIPLGIDNSGQWSSAIELPALEREAFLDALIGSGLERHEAERISKRSARNLAVLRRQLEFNRLIPEWAQARNVRDMIPAMLVGRWDENLEGDRAIIEFFAEQDYDSYIVKLKQWLYTGDTPIVQIGGTWRLTSPLDAWTYAGKYCTRADLGKLKTIFLKVFGEIDPKFELASEERHRVSWHGIQRTHSSWLREGLAQSLILISVYGDKIDIDLPTKPETWVDNVIAMLLLSDNSEFWKSIDYEMPLLAEASPMSFVERLEELLQIENGPVYQLFEEEKGFLHNQSYYTGLLWALENIAWIPQFLTRAALSLAKLAEQDPGGSLTNRPINSLREIFKSWFPQTLAPLSDRMEALKVVVHQYNEIGQIVIKSLLPSKHGIAKPTHKMRWRLSDETITYNVTYDELYETHTKAVELLLQHFDQTEDSFNELVEKSFDLNHWDRITMLEFLEQQLDNVKHKNNVTWHTLRKAIARYRTYPDAEWSLPEEILERYVKLYERLTPVDLVEQTSWILREQWPESVEGEVQNLEHKERAKIIQNKKVEAVKTLYKNYGLGKLLEISTELSSIELRPMAFAVADVINNEKELYQIWENLKTDDLRRDFGQYIIDRKRRVVGNDYVFDLYVELKSKGFEKKALTNIFLKLHADSQLWAFIDKADPALVDDYWKKIDSFYFSMLVQDLTEGIKRLMKYHRYTSALHLASNVADQLDGELLVEILLGFINTPEQNVRLNGYEIEYIFDELRKNNETDHDLLIRLEWLYLPFLDRGFDQGNTPILHQEMADNPEFFIQVLEQLYETETESPEEPELSDEQIQQKVLMAQSAYKLFQTWYIIPGVDKDGNIDSEKLKRWVDEVIDLSKAGGRLKFAEGKMGAVFAKYPERNQRMEPDKELNWPPDVLCEIMEGIDSESLFDNFRTNTYNKRSFSTRGPFDGGARERHIATYFRKLAGLKSARYPRIGAVLEGLAQDFEHQAKYEDERAERDKLDY